MYKLEVLADVCRLPDLSGRERSLAWMTRPLIIELAGAVRAVATNLHAFVVVDLPTDASGGVVPDEALGAMQYARDMFKRNLLLASRIRTADLARFAGEGPPPRLECRSCTGQVVMTCRDCAGAGKFSCPCPKCSETHDCSCNAGRVVCESCSPTGKRMGWIGSSVFDLDLIAIVVRGAVDADIAIELVHVAGRAAEICELRLAGDGWRASVMCRAADAEARAVDHRLILPPPAAKVA